VSRLCLVQVGVSVFSNNQEILFSLLIVLAKQGGSRDADQLPVDLDRLTQISTSGIVICGSSHNLGGSRLKDTVQSKYLVPRWACYFLDDTAGRCSLNHLPT
jgi:hypothetical protein